MTNTTTNITTNTNTNINTNEEAPMFIVEDTRKQEFVSILTSILNSNGQPPMQALVIATAMLGSIDKLGLVSIDKWVKNVDKYIHKTGEQGTSVTVIHQYAEPTLYTVFEIPLWFDTVVHADLITREGVVGDKMLSLIAPKELSHPSPMGQRVARRHPMVPSHVVYMLVSKVSPLAKRAMEIQEKTEYIVDTYMLAVGKALNEVYPSPDLYVIKGCETLVARGNVPVVSEFKGDRRVRTYQSDCHGPQFASGDESRSYMDLANVSTNYDAATAITVIRDEMMDMIVGSNLDGAIKQLRTTESLIAFMQYQLVLKQHDDADTMPEGLQEDLILKKVFSFVKANRILHKLELGFRPYIGMAFGLDAKCSGPQYGAIMTGDIKIAEACGFGVKRASRDAYELTIDICEKKGIHGLTRPLIKKAYMGIFYGQGAFTFSDTSNYGPKPDQHNPRLLKVLQGIPLAGVAPEELLTEQAKVFHAAVESGFGNMSALRKELKKAHYHYEDIDGVPTKVFDTTKPTMYSMPDGSRVAMDYREQVTVEGASVTPMIKTPDVIIDIAGVGTLKFEKLTFNTKKASLSDQARTGFVNMIQATDALVARNILCALDDLGAQHAISVHDCFRVNINDFIAGKLHSAIKTAYKEVFVNTTSESDILKNYFQGVRDAGGIFPKSSIAFMLDAGELKMADWVDVEGIIDNLENKIEGKEGSYYFAK